MIKGRFGIGDEIEVVVGDDLGRYRLIHTGGDPTLSRVEPLCEACGENDAGDYETGGGHHVCPACVNRALFARIIHDVFTLENIGDNDVPLARVMTILDEDDARMRASTFPYVDSHDSARDMIAGMSDDELRDGLWGAMRDTIRTVCP